MLLSGPNLKLSTKFILVYIDKILPYFKQNSDYFTDTEYNQLHKKDAIY